jgi:hypothetical protein
MFSFTLLQHNNTADKNRNHTNNHQGDLLSASLAVPSHPVGVMRHISLLFRWHLGLGCGGFVIEDSIVLRMKYGVELYAGHGPDTVKLFWDIWEKK